MCHTGAPVSPLVAICVASVLQGCHIHGNASSRSELFTYYVDCYALPHTSVLSHSRTPLFVSTANPWSCVDAAIVQSIKQPVSRANRLCGVALASSVTLHGQATVRYWYVRRSTVKQMGSFRNKRFPGGLYRGAGDERDFSVAHTYSGGARTWRLLRYPYRR